MKNKFLMIFATLPIFNSFAENCDGISIGELINAIKHDVIAKHGQKAVELKWPILKEYAGFNEMRNSFCNIERMPHGCYSIGNNIIEQKIVFEYLEDFSDFISENNSLNIARFSNRGTPLQIAADLGLFNTAKFLLKQGVLVDDKGNDDMSPLFISVMNGNYNLTKLLLDNGASVCAKDGTGRTPLFVAVMDGDLQMTEMLMNYGASVYDVCDGKSVFDIAQLNDTLFFDHFQNITKKKLRENTSFINMLTFLNNAGTIKLSKLYETFGITL